MSGIVSVLKKTDIFYQFTHTQLEMIAGVCQECTFHKGDIVFLEGADSDELYIIAQGEIEILVTSTMSSNQSNGQPREVILEILKRGQSFGEIALVDQGLRTATTRASQNNTRLLVIPRQKLMQLCDTYPQLGYQLMRNLAADLAFKMRGSGLRFREQVLYGSQKKQAAP